jgi:hypothetical protein
VSASRWLRLARRWFAAITSGLLTCLLLELVFRLFLPHLPLTLYSHLPEGARVLGQSSKAASVPRQYVAVLGDSYAAGAGDWVRATNPRRSEEFHSAHLIHDALGVDVVSFGVNGAGSLRGIVTAPIGQLRYLAELKSVGAPDVFLVYFYAGNDLNNNLEDLRLRYQPRFAAESLRDPRVFEQFLSVVVGEDELFRRARAGVPWIDRFLLGRVAFDTLRHPGNWMFDQTPVTDSGLNRAVVAGREVGLPDALQSPSLELTEDEVGLGVYVLERSLAYLQKTYPAAQIRVVYVPSPLECYTIVSPKVDIQTYEGRARAYATTALESRARLVTTSVQAAAGRLGMRFVDATPFLRRASETRFVHGPLDWKHYNRAGYQALADAGVAAIRQP